MWFLKIQFLFFFKLQFFQDNIVSHIILLIILFVAIVRNVTHKKGQFGVGTNVAGY
jgi:hypothetical protein